MHSLAIPSLYLLAGISAYAALFHLIIGLRRPFDHTNLVFASMCLAIVVYAILNASTMQAADLARFVLSLKWNISVIIVFLGLFPWFIALYSERQQRIVPSGLAALMIMLFVINLTQPYSLQFDQLDNIKTLQLPWGETVTRGVGHNGFWAYIVIGTVVLEFGYALYILGSAYLRHRRITDLGMILAVLIFLLGSVQGILVRLSAIDFIELGPFAYLAMVIVMSVILSYETQQRLRNSERNFRSLFENSPTAMVAIDPVTRRIVEANQNALEMFGYSADTMLTKTIADIIHPDELEDSQRRYDQLTAGSVDHMHYERRFLRQDGSAFPADTSIATLKDGTGIVVRLIASAIDITERKTAENKIIELNKELAISEERARKALLASNTAVWDYDLTTGNVYLSDAWSKFLGGAVTPTFTTIQELTELVPVEDRQMVATEIMKAVKGHDSSLYQITYRVNKPDGDFIWILSEGNVIERDQDGRALRMIGINSDITEQKTSEDDLRASNDKLRNLYELSPVGIALTDLQGHYLEFNKAFERICGYTREELNKLDYWELTPKEYASQEAEQLDSLNKTGRYGPYEKEYIRKDRSRIPLLLNGVLVQGKDGLPYIWSIVEDITERKLKDDLIWAQANFDSLTELPNRRLFLDRMEQEIKKSDRVSSPLALLFIDLDRFKEVNDTLGHVKGDLLLIEAAYRIRGCVRNADTVSRLGGDEFTVILSNFGERVHLERIVQDIIQSMSKPFDLGEDNVAYTTASVGIALYPDDARDMDELMKHADQAMYEAKDAGRNRFCYFIPSMQMEALEKQKLTNDLRYALGRGELEVHYQPIIELASGRIEKAEALLRWHHPQRGDVGPAVFIPLAEEFGLIHEIGDWVFLQTIDSIANWRKEFGRIVQVSVNRSPVEFDKGSSSWVDILASTDLPGSSITIEITEGLLLKKSEKVSQYLLACRNHGIEISIDDFGTGFSALSYLKLFDIDYLKIDRSFVSNLTSNESDKALVEAIILMAHKLGIKTIAEGIETEEQSDLLIAFGCDYAQGYLYSRPVPVCEFAKLL